MISKKNVKYIVCAAVLCMALLAVFGSGALASGSGTCGDNLTWSLNSNGVLTISGSGSMYDYDAMGDYTTAPWDSQKNQISSVVFGNGITHIGKWAFYYCESITNVTVPSSVTSIGEGAFYTCSSLTGIVLPDSVQTIGSNAFDQCSSLESARLPEQLSSIPDYLFCNCPNLSTIEIPGTVTSIGVCSFYYSGLNNVTIPASVTQISEAAFSGCYSLQNISVSSSNSQYSSVDGVLFNKNKTRLIQYPAGKEDYSYTIPDTVTYVEDMSYGNFGEVIIPDSVVTIGDGAFCFCWNLHSLSIPWSVTRIGGYLFNYSGIKNITVDDNNSVYSSVDGVLFNKSQSRLFIYPAARQAELYIVPDSVTAIKDYAFFECGYLKNIIIPDSVTSIGADAFRFCENMKMTVVQDSAAYRYAKKYGFPYTIGTDSTVKGTWGDLSWTFKSSSGQLTISGSGPMYGFDLWDDSEAWRPYSSKIKKVVIQDGVTSVGYYAFGGCNVTSVTLPESIEEIGDIAFYNCTELKNIVIPSKVSWIPYFCFANCYNMTSITLPDSITGFGEYCFLGCSGLTSVSVPEGVTFIGEEAFNVFNPEFYLNIHLSIPAIEYAKENELQYRITAKGALILPEGVTAVDDEAFMGTAFSAVSVPDGCTSIGSRAFANCTKLKYVLIPVTTTDIADDAFSGCNDVYFDWCQPD